MPRATPRQSPQCYPHERTRSRLPLRAVGTLRNQSSVRHSPGITTPSGTEDAFSPRIAHAVLALLARLPREQPLLTPSRQEQRPNQPQRDQTHQFQPSSASQLPGRCDEQPRFDDWSEQAEEPWVSACHLQQYPQAECDHRLSLLLIGCGPTRRAPGAAADRQQTDPAIMAMARRWL